MRSYCEVTSVSFHDVNALPHHLLYLMNLIYAEILCWGGIGGLCNNMVLVHWLEVCPTVCFLTLEPCDARLWPLRRLGLQVRLFGFITFDGNHLDRKNAVEFINECKMYCWTNDKKGTGYTWDELCELISLTAYTLRRFGIMGATLIILDAVDGNFDENICYAILVLK